MSGAGLHLTFDLDWAPDFALEDLRELLGQSGAATTVFCTHRSDGVDRIVALPGIETAIHPNFLGASDEEGKLRELLGWFPGVRGVRNHRLYYHSGLAPLFRKAGLLYLSNDLLFLEPDLRPYRDWAGLVRLPIYWEDDIHCACFGDRFEERDLALDRSGLRILNFHPVHLYLNTNDLRWYQAHKEEIRDERKARSMRRPGRGIRTLFEGLLGRLRAAELETLGATADRFVAAHPDGGRG
jgi:hypothetical protein